MDQKRRAATRRGCALSEHDVDVLLQKLQRQDPHVLTPQDLETLTGVVQTWAHLTEIAGRKTARIGEVRKVLGLAVDASKTDESGGDPVDCPAREASPLSAASLAQDETGEDRVSRRSRHGRRCAEDFRDVEEAHHAHVSLPSGDRCPGCLQGRVYKYRPRVFTTISGRSPLVATRHTLETLQCNLCKDVFQAPLPAVLEADGVDGRTLYTHSAVAIVCILRCFGGLPMHRQDRLQRTVGVVVSDSSIWDMHERLANALRPVWRTLVMLSAQAQVFFGDDTGATILSSRSQVRSNRRTGELKRRTGCHTTCVIAKLDDGHTAVMFFTGIHHTGEIMDLIVEGRHEDLPPPIFMGDCIESNTVTACTVYYAGCNAHAVRRFKELAERYPDQTGYALERYRAIYDNEDAARKEKLSPEQRRDYHQEHSRPLLREIAEYGEDLFEKRKVEPNSDLGRAFEYLIGNERRLSAFARHQNAPLDNNSVERVLRICIRLRETTRFFRNAVGAGVADTILTVGTTAMHYEVNLIDYFVDIQRHAEDVRENPTAWLPWNYRLRKMKHGQTGPPARTPPIIATT